MRRLALLVVLAAACGDNRTPSGPRTPEDVAHNGVDGKTVLVEGLVHALTFDSTPTDGSYPLLPDRFLLLRTSRPPGVSLADLDTGRVVQAWGLGVRIKADALATAPLPQVGDRVRVTGTFRKSPWSGAPMAMIEDGRIEILSSTLTLGMIGATCHHDLDCHDRLVCDRATLQCAPPAETVIWGEDWRNLHGSCTTDDDCPLPQVCDARYTTATTGQYAPPYFVARDGGKHLCVAPDGASLASLCPRMVTASDYLGGRYVGGKEICVDTKVWLPITAADGDTHLQLTVDEPLPYPLNDSTYNVAGAPTEISPPYKDPARPQGTLVDPAAGDHIVLIGTVRYDDDHGWFEVHSVKTYVMQARGPGAAAFQAQYPSHPTELDWEAIEHGRSPAAEKAKGERAHALELERQRGMRLDPAPDDEDDDERGGVDDK